MFTFLFIYAMMVVVYAIHTHITRAHKRAVYTMLAMEMLINESTTTEEEVDRHGLTATEREYIDAMDDDYYADPEYGAWDEYADEDYAYILTDDAPTAWDDYGYDMNAELFGMVMDMYATAMHGTVWDDDDYATPTMEKMSYGARYNDSVDEGIGHRCHTRLNGYVRADGKKHSHYPSRKPYAKK